MKRWDTLRTKISSPWLWYAVAGLGLMVYIYQGWHFLHHQEVVLDEGLYLYKGWLFVRGVYRPFQPYGPWTNHMPFSFLFYGLVQVFFGKGLFVGRAASLGISVLALLVLWAWVRHWAGARWAAWAVWAWALTPMLPRIYSLALSEGPAMTLALGAAALVWRRAPKTIHWVLAGVLAGTLAATRLNMFPVPVVLGVYAFTRSRRAGMAFSVPALVVIVGVHVLYWPDILRLWLKWVPFPLPRWPFLVRLGLWPGGQRLWQGPTDTQVRVLGFFIQLYALAWFSWAIGILGLWKAWRSERYRVFRDEFRVALWLSALGFVLVVLHGIATLYLSSLRDALLVYGTFFVPLFLLLMPLGVRLGAWETSPFALIGLAALLLGGIASGAYGDVVKLRVAWAFRFRKMFGNHVFSLLARVYHAMLGGLAWLGVSGERARLALWGGVLLSMLALGVWLLRKISRRGAPYLWVAGMLALMAASPSRWLGAAYPVYDCPDGLYRAEVAGKTLARFIRPDDRLYWRGGKPALLLYLPETVHIFPAQLNGPFNFRIGGNTELLHRLGMWNEELDRRWQKEATVMVLTESALNLPQAWKQVGQTPSVTCKAKSALRIFRPVSQEEAP